MSENKKNISVIPLNRVEGDLEIKVEMDKGAVSEAWSKGTMFRGFEKILVGRGPLDGLVFTPRICGMCSTAHLTVAAKALDMISGVKIPDNAQKIRNLALMAEHLQSDIRHTFLLFLVDLANEVHKDHSLYEEAVRRYTAFKGESGIEAIKASKGILEIVGIIGGQWPHSAYMVPGGVVSIPDASELLNCVKYLGYFRKWYEDRVLGCTLDRWADVKSEADLNAWLEENESHANSEVGFFIRYTKEAGLDKLGKGHGNFVCFGAIDMPGDTEVKANGNGGMLVPQGFAKGTDIKPFDQELIAEHVRHSWFEDYDGGKHPAQGETNPYATGDEGTKYSWCKAPRYEEVPAETGPLAELIMSGHPLITDLINKNGPNVMVRQLARMIRGTTLMPAMSTWLNELIKNSEKHYKSVGEIEEGEGFGITEASRGAIGHWVKIENKKIKHYQVITPTAWHASPRDTSGVRGPWEEALIGTEVKDINNPVELGHVVRSFDPCLVCTVHAVGNGKTLGKTQILV